MIAGVVVLAVVVAAVVLLRRRSGGGGREETTAVSAPAERHEPAPMTGLEAALAQVTDRDGRPIGEHIDAEAPRVDDLRVPDDTGPVLRRALDRVEHQADRADGAGSDTAGGPPASAEAETDDSD